MIAEMLFQLLLVLVPILAYYFFINENMNRRNKVNLTLILIFMLLMVMSFPIEYNTDYRYDFRVLPIMIAFIFGGFSSGITLVAVLFIIRLAFGGDGIILSVICYTFLTVLFLLLKGRLNNAYKKKKIYLISIIYWLFIGSKALILTLNGQSEQFPLLVTFYLFVWVILLIITFLIENLYHSWAMSKDLQRAERLNVISQLAASVAHEVRNPLTTIRGFLQLMESDGHVHASHKNYIKIALNELNHAQAIINDYLSLAKPHTEGSDLVNLSEEVRNTVELMKSYSNIQSITIESLIKEPLFIQGNKAEIKQVLVNIIKNGIESMEAGGILSVQAYEKEENVYIEIKDSGQGMSAVQIRNLGTPFYTTKENGTGVGLMISFQLIESMKGKVKIESKTGEGTKFTIQFPGAAS
ncbi:ATP-binding protein [Bacillus massiliglaciei]|uniref:ATP-binding protein n=1 Tax=Bacillus massiliglaciei TaxID=1816693 RepID=UPI000B196901|nr:sensor histidine kinase [Bacillus massiliglaciei]